MALKGEEQKSKTKIDPSQMAKVSAITSAPDKLKTFTGLVQAKPGKLKGTAVVTRTLKKVEAPKTTVKTIGSSIQKAKSIATPTSKPMGGELSEVKVKGSPESNLEFGVGTDRKMFPREDIIGAAKAGFLSGIDVTSNNTIRQSAGKYNRMIPELELGIQLYKNKLKKQQENK